MFENARTTRIATLGILAVILALTAVAPAMAWTSKINSTSLNPSACSTGCSTASVTDTAYLTLTNDGAPRGSITFKVYAAAAGATCAPSGSPLFTDTESVPSTGTAVDSTHTQFTITSAAFSTGSNTGNFVWMVSYSGTGSNGYPAAGPTCENMVLLSFPPPTSSPEFPLGMVLLLAVAFPGLLLVKGRFATKSSVPTA